MLFSESFRVVETHTAGNPTRHIIESPKVEGSTMGEKAAFFEANYDYIRRMTTFEPRGSESMSDTIYTDPCNSNCDIGVIFCERSGYLNFCGHSIIAASKVVKDYHLINEDKESIFFDTPSGPVKTYSECIGDQDYIFFDGSPAFYCGTYEIAIGDNKVLVDISYGGCAFAIVESASLNITISKESLPELMEYAKAIHKIVSCRFPFFHPDTKLQENYHGVAFYEKLNHTQNYLTAVIAVSGENSTKACLDRSPCGAGTAAKLAAEYSKGSISVGNTLEFYSLSGEKFIARVNDEASTGDNVRVIPSIGGQPFITTESRFVLEKNDKLGTGFTI